MKLSDLFYLQDMYKLIVLTLFLTTILSCNENLTKEKKKVNTVTGEFIFNLQLMYPDNERNPSFPVMFNESIIKKNKIRKFERKVLNRIDLNDAAELLKEEQVFVFNSEGQVMSHELRSYYEGLLYHDVNIVYENDLGPFGHRNHKVASEKDYKEIGLEAKDILQKSELLEITENKIVLKKGNRKEFYALKEKCWNPVSIDTMFKPQKKDLIFFGSPSYPHKRYQVEDLVKESNTISYEYDVKNLTRIVHVSYPFEFRRNIIYNTTGDCIGFIDSTFSEQIYLNRKVYEYKLSKSGLPVALYETSNPKKQIKLETYLYDFYDEND